MGRSNLEDRPPTKDHRITIRLDDVEHAHLTRAARRSGLAPSVLMRAAALDLATGQQRSTAAWSPHPPSTRPSPSLDPPLEELRIELKRVGVSLNQLTRLGNHGGYVPVLSGDDQPALHQLLLELRDTVNGILVELGAVAPQPRS